MRPGPSRAVAIAFLALLTLPVVPAELFGITDSAVAQEALIPQGVVFQDWQASHDLYVDRVAASNCPLDPATQQAGIPGDRRCQLPMNTTKSVDLLSARTTRVLVTAGSIPENPGGQQVNVPDASRAWARISPEVKHPMKVNGLAASVSMSVPGLTTCAGLRPTGAIRVLVEVRALQSGDPGEQGQGLIIGSASREICPVDAYPGLFQGGFQSSNVIFPVDVEVPVTGGVAPLIAEQRLQMNVAVERQVGGEWNLEYDSQSAPTRLTVRSPDAFQFAAWMEDRDRKVTTLFAIPQAAGDRFSASGFLAFKTAFGGYDNPRAKSSPPQPATDAQWTMKVIAPDGSQVSLRDPAFQGRGPNGQEFQDCVDNWNDFLTCLDQSGVSPDASIRVFRMPSRPVVPGSSNVWNYTAERINAIAPGGGEFKLEITGQVRGVPIANRLPDGVRFTVGGFGVRLNPLRAGGVEESLTHTLCTQAVSAQCSARSTTFLLNVTNVAPKADNFTLTTDFLTCAPASVPCSQWAVAYGGRDVKGADVVFLNAFNSSLLKVTVTPPAGASAATMRVTARSQSAPDEKDEEQLSVQVSSTLVRGAGVFLFPDDALKSVRRGERQTFNYTVWNRGTDADSFSVNCDQGPDLSVNPVTLLRNDDTWNGTIRLGASTIGCRDINATRVLTANIPAGDTREATVTVEASANATARPQMTIVVKAESQGDSSKSDRAAAEARLETRRSFKLFILTEGTNVDDPQSTVQATRVLRTGKDLDGICPDTLSPETCTGDEGPPVYNQDHNGDIQFQKWDWNYSEFAFYRLTIVNDGDEVGDFNVQLGEIRNQTLETAAEDNCPSQNIVDAFSASRRQERGVGMKDEEGVTLLRRPVIPWPSPDTERASVMRVAPGKSAVFYLRVHQDWNRHNVSQFNAAGSIGLPIACNSLSDVTVQVTAPNYPSQSVRAITRSLIAGEQDRAFSRSLVITQGIRQPDGSFEGDFPQSCPPATPPDSGDRVYCKYVKPGQILPGCGCSVSWYFTASKFWGPGDDFELRPLRRVGGLSLTDLINRGWRFSGPTVIPEDIARRNGTIGGSDVGDEVKIQVDVTVPANATVNDFAGLQVEVAGRKSGASAQISFFTVGAQKFKVGLTNLAGVAPIEIHPGDRAAINLNVSNEGAAVDVYNITIPTSLPQGYAPFFQPNETRVSPSRNKTVTVFVQAPNAGQFPQTVTGVIRVQSTVNLSQLRGETFNETSFTVVVRERLADNVGLGVVGIETKPIDNGGSVTFSLNVTNPAPNAKTFVLRRLPSQAVLRQFVDGWTDVVGEPCFEVPGRGPGGAGTKQVSFTITAAIDALEGTHVTYPLRVDEATAQCQPLAQNPNFAQALVTATVIGTVGLEVQPLDPVKVVPRGGTTSLPVRVRNVGTAGDTFFFQSAFVNQSQALPPNPWSTEVRTSEGAAVQSLFVDPQTSRIVFVNVSAPLNIPFLGVRSDLDFTVRGTDGNPASVRLTAFVQDYDIRVRIANSTVDAAPGQSLFFTLNLTNAGNGIDTHDILADIGGLRGFWNVSTEFSAVTLLNGTSKDILITVQVPKSPLPTTGAVIGVTVRSKQVDAMRPAAEALGAGSPLVALLNTVPKTGLISVNLYPYVSLDVDGDREPELAIDRNRNSADGFEVFQDPFTSVGNSVDLLAADGDEDRRIDHFVDIDLDGRPERYWDPDDGRLTAIGGSVRGSAGAATEAYPDVNNDGTLEFLFDSDADLAVDLWIDPATRRTGEAVERDFDDDGNPEFLIDTNGDGRPDRYFDGDRGPRGLVTNVELAPGGNPQQYGIDTNGGGRPTKVYDSVTGEVTTASFSSVGAFFADFWYLILLFLAVAALAGYLVYQRRQQKPPGG